VAIKISIYLVVPILKRIEQFKDGERQANYEENNRGKHVFIIHSTFVLPKIYGIVMLVDASYKSFAD
jgi:phosphoribosylpyrophosphate synthetase